MKSIIQRHHTLISILVLLFGVVWIGITAKFFKVPTDRFIPAPKEGFLAPEIILSSTTGNTIILENLQGQAVLLNFWTSWCPPCRTEMPAMQRIYDDYKDQGFEILAINATYQDNVSEASEFIDTNRLTFPVLLDINGTTTRRYLVNSFPTSFFIDKNGLVYDVVIGGPMSEALIETRIQNLLGEVK
jgi:thiol-disulfide isomerase/thioredoxin